MSSRRDLLLGLGASLFALPLAGLAQTGSRIRRVGVLALRRGPESEEWEWSYNLLAQRLKEFGYLEGKDVAFEWRFASGDYSRLPELAAELVRLNVDVIVTDGSQGIRTAQGATKTIPIVFAGGTDVVASGFVKSLSRPGGNTTGVSLLLNDSIGKQVELLGRMVPKLSRLAVLTNPTNLVHPALLKTIREAAATLGAQVVHVEARDTKGIGEAFPRAVGEGAGALIWIVDSFFIQNQRQFAELASKYRLPTITGVIEYPEVGGLMGYGPNRRGLWRRVAEYVDMILRGANPGEIPVEQPKRLELVINRKTAKALGLEIPAELLVLADKVIE